MKKEHKPQTSAIKNVYVLSFTSGNIIKFNQLFIQLLAFEEFEASLIKQMIIEEEILERQPETVFCTQN